MEGNPKPRTAARIRKSFGIKDPCSAKRRAVGRKEGINLQEEIEKTHGGGGKGTSKGGGNQEKEKRA